MRCSLEGIGKEPLRRFRFHSPLRVGRIRAHCRALMNHGTKGERTLRVNFPFRIPFVFRAVEIVFGSPYLQKQKSFLGG